MLLVVLLALCACTDGASEKPADRASSQPASPAASHFLDTYVTEDGRVLRTDQGSDIVSEGQAYAMLIALHAGRKELVPTIWAWTREHLMRDDGLLSFHAAENGTVLGADPASDADVLAAYALLTYDGDEADALHDEGKALAAAVLQHEVVTDDSGRAILAAGPWAVEPRVVNPSYLMPGVFSALAELTGDDTWTELAETSVPLVASVTDDGRLLPPDWAHLEGSTLVPLADASGTPGPGQYGPDAQRVPLWMAAACAEEGRDLAGRWWSILQQHDRSSALTLTTEGEVRDAGAHPLALLAAAATAEAAGDADAVEDLTRGARETAEGAPGYYGDAWLALAEDVPGSCN